METTMVKADDVKKLREQTGAGIMDCKIALEEAKGDFDKAIDIVRKKGADVAMKKAGREATEGAIFSYIHSNNKIGVLVELTSETDFVAKNEEFQTLGKDIAIHIAASDPQYITPDQVPEELIEKEKEIYTEQLKKEGKPEDIIVKILVGKIKKFKDEVSLLSQPFVRDDKKSIKELVEQAIGKIGENIQIKRFARFEIAGGHTACVLPEEGTNKAPKPEKK